MLKPGTPLPWEVDDGDSECFGIFAKEDADAVAYCSERPTSGTGLRGYEVDKANAVYLCRAANLFPELVAMLTEVASGIADATIHGGPERAARIRELLAKAKE